MTAYIKTDNGEWTVLGGLSSMSLVGYAPTSLEMYSKPLPTTYETTMTFKLSKFGRVDSMMLWFGLSRKEARRVVGVKPILRKGKAWRT